MKSTALLLTAGLGLLSLTAAAQETVTSYPINQRAVVCDTLDQVKSIAESPMPQILYGMYAETLNSINEPTCALGQFASVSALDTTSLGLMVIDGKKWDATAVHVIAPNGQEAYILAAVKHDDGI